ncbi:hypothetical protein LG302_02940 [Halomonas organivorans]
MRTSISEDRKREIRAEEVFRAEVRHELATQARQDHGVMGKIAAFMDTKHGMFFASSVLLPLLVWFYSYATNYYASQADRQQYHEKLEYEVQARLSRFSGKLESGNVTGFREDVDRDHLYPQLAGYGMEMLLVELARTAPGDEVIALEDIRKAMDEGDAQRLLALLDQHGWIR